MWTDTIQIIKDHITSGVYEPSTMAYYLHWFCILKANRRSLHLIHDLQPLNVVFHPTVCWASHRIICRICGLDLTARFDQWLLAEKSQDLTTFNSPLGPHCLITVLMGYTNAVQIYQADMVFILQDEILQHTTPFIDNVPGKRMWMGITKSFQITWGSTDLSGSIYKLHIRLSNGWRMSTLPSLSRSSFLPYPKWQYLATSAPLKVMDEM